MNFFSFLTAFKLSINFCPAKDIYQGVPIVFSSDFFVKVHVTIENQFCFGKGRRYREN